MNGAPLPAEHYREGAYRKTPPPGRRASLNEQQLPQQDPSDRRAADLEWHRVLYDLEHGLAEAARATQLLARLLELQPTSRLPMPPSHLQAPPPVMAPPPSESPEAEPEQRAAPAGPEVFERLWDRMERERANKGSEKPAAKSKEPRGLDLLPQSYLITVEDRRGKVNMVPLHRALLSLPNVRDANLVSYANGVPIVSVQSQGELSYDELVAAVSEAMARECEIIPQDNNKLYLRLAA
jgi:hypothetical protein